MTHAPEAKTRWPKGARAVVNITIHVDGPSVEAGRGQTPLGINSRGHYAIRRGVYRYLDMLARHGIPATFFCCGHDGEHWPGIVRDIHAAGHEIAAHGYRHEGFDLGDREPELLEKTHRILTGITGIPPVGWCSPSGRKTTLTLPTLRRLGYRYDTSEKDEDLPYLLDDRFAILPNNTVSLDDFPLYHSGHALPSEAGRNFIEEFDALVEGDGYIHFIVHPKAGGGSGSPARAAQIDRFLAHCRSRSDVAFLTCRELADHCLSDPQRWLEPRA